MPHSRRCCACREPFTPRYHRTYRCDACAAAKYRAWYEKNREYAKAVMRAKFKPHRVDEHAPWRTRRVAA